MSSCYYENYHIFDKGLAKNTFTICNAGRLLPDDTAKVSIFYKRDNTHGVLR